MSVQLLDKTRKINKLLHNSNSSKVIFNDICQVLMETLSSNILVLSKKGKVLGVSLCPGVEEITELIEDKVGGYVDALLNERFLGVLSTKENVNLQTLGFELLTPNEAQINEALALSGDMEVWPEANGIKESDNVIVIYFSEPTEQWYSVNGVQMN